MIDKRSSEHIKLTALFATITVVIRHSFNIHVYRPNILNTGPYDINSFVQLLGLRCTASAVPVFFLLSGYLFFYGLHEKGLLRKWTSRFHSLAVPYLAWNSLYLLCLLVMPHISLVERFSVQEQLTLSPRTLVEKLTLDPAAGHFWYVRDLMAFVVLAPLLRLIYRQRWLAGLSLAGLLLYWQPVDCSVLSSEGLFFFFLGGWIGYRHLSLGCLRFESSWVSGAMCVLWLGLCSCQTLWPLQGFYRQITAKVSTLMGAALLWLLVGRFNNLQTREKVLGFAPYAFLIYALHTPMVRYIYKVLLSLQPEIQYYSFIVYVATPVITTTICALTAKVIVGDGGGLCSVLTGGRVPLLNRRRPDASGTTT